MEKTRKPFWKALTFWIFVGMVVGFLIGWLVPDIGAKLAPLSAIFIRLIKCVIAPLIFATLIIGIAGHSNLRETGRIGLKAIIYFEVVTTLALILGLLAVNIARPGDGVADIPLAGASIPTVAKQTLSDVLIHTFPENFIKSCAEGQVLQIVVFTILFAIALSFVESTKKKVMLDFCESLAEVMFKFTGIIMKYAPVGVAGAIAVVVAGKGPEILLTLGKLVATLYGALIIFVLAVFLPIILLLRIPLKRFLAAVKEPALIAFSTANSEAALPKAMQNMEKMGIPRHIVSFVLPTGYSFNLDGSTLYLSLAVIFTAQVAGLEMTLWQQIVIVLTLMLTSKGVAGVSRASFVVLTGTLVTFGIPMEGALLIFGVDQFMDMGRTTVNVIGNSLASAVVARWEGVDFNETPAPTS